MQCFTVSSNEIEGRLDCFFYAPKNQVSIKSKFPLVTVKDVTINVIHPPEYKRIYAAYGYQLLRAQNVKPLGIEINSNKVFLDKEYLKGGKLISPEIGDVLVVRSGVNTGDCAVIEKDYVDLILGADNLVCKCNDTINPFFLKTYLSLNIGRKILSLYQTGATNYHITPENLKKIKIPLPPLSIQNQIVEIMQSAYSQKKQMEAEAQRLLDSIDSYVLDELGIKLPKIEDKMCFIVDVEEVKGNRMDTYYYQPKFEEVEKALRKGRYQVKLLNEFCNEITSGQRPKGGVKKISEGIPSLGGEHILSNGLIATQDLKFIPNDFHQSHLKSKVQKNDILIVKDGATTGKSGIVPEDYPFEDVNINEHVFLVRCKRELNPYYLLSFLKSQIGQIQINRQITGGTIMGIIREQIVNLSISLPPLPVQTKIAEEVKKRMSEAERLKAEANKIIEEAKKTVEDIILLKD